MNFAFWKPLVLSAALALCAAPAQALIFTVTSTGDTGPGSLRQAILDANAAGAAASIQFNIPPPGPYVIRPNSALPNITSAVVIDGTTQPGYAGSPLVVLNGVNAGDATGLTLQGGSSTIRGLVINRFGGSGIMVYLNSGNVIQGNYLGTDITGRSNAPNTQADIYLLDSADNLIGGTTAAARNVIAGQSQAGIYLEGSAARGNVIMGNFIGTDVTGTTAVGSLHNGVLLFHAPGNTIGGTTAAARNVISGNMQSGVYIFGANAAANVVQGNFIGTDVTGLSRITNLSDGITIWGASSNLIGGAVPGAGNVISGNGEHGVFLGGTNTFANVIAGNLIGLSAPGTSGLGNGFSGVGLEGTNIVGNRVGGPSASERNFISGNRQSGINLSGLGVTNNIVQGNWIGLDITGSRGITNEFDGITIQNASGTLIAGNVVAANGLAGVFLGDISRAPTRLEGNRVGTDATGRASLANSGSGLDIHNCPATRIGGAAPGAGNVLSGNGEFGIYMTNSARCVLQANFVGTDSTGTAALGNTLDGVLLSDSPDLLIGGTVPGLGNLISGNGDSGLYLFGPATRRALIQGNILGASIRGTNAILNRLDGLTLYNAPSNNIGGVGFGVGNLISGNNDSGITILGSQSQGNVVKGNFIGTGPDGILRVENRLHGVQIEDGIGNQIGGLGANEGNIIAYNRTNLYDGVRIRSGTGNHVARNSIFSHAGLGIDLGPDGVTPNDNRDVDNGANNLQNYPVLTSAATSAGSTTVQGTFNSERDKNFRLDFFSSPFFNTSGFGEGQTYLDSMTVLTDGSGNASFVRALPVAVPAGYILTATATDSANNTSEFSSWLAVTGSIIGADLAVTTSISAGTLLPGSLVTLDVTVQNRGANGAYDVRLAQKLPAGLVFVSAAPSATTFFVDTLTFNLGTLANGASATIRLTLQVMDYGALNAVASVTSGVPDPVPGNNSATATVNVPGPRLSIRTDGTELVLSWPAVVSGFTLESKASLGTPGGWSAVPGTPTLVAGEYQVRLTPASGAFFRLRR